MRGKMRSTKRKNGLLRQMSRMIKTATIAGVLMAAAGPFSTMAAPSEQPASGPAREIEQAEQVKENPYNGDVNTLRAAGEATQLIVVIGNPADPAKGTLTWYQKGENGAFYPALSVEAVSGMNGISTGKQEGDKKTPAGVYSFSMAFGMKDNPGTILPYHKITAGDQYVDDGNSRYYNQLVNDREVEKDWNSAENLITQAPQYNYALVLNYNEERVPGKGSAIFLHCPKAANNTGTSGCISIPEEKMREVICAVDEGTKIIVVQNEADLAAY